ncbi:sensor histidine kinase [Fibrivirga algicola]|uniref:histidine kinase n=1 Tax=Fibrivirga algicola TaxID=2950420 RepID=A0ABX0QR78_9BACT|nr:PAS domain-containing sensor histidine kinase [Fibrivirga algicola]NID13477.1 PAS domain-containing sensor histidine kinase [Fibrivirga algicola]
MLPNLYSNALTDLLFKTNVDCIGIYDLTSERFVSINQAGLTMLGYTLEDDLLLDPIRSKSLRTLPLDAYHRALLASRLREGKEYQEMVQIDRRDGRIFWGQLTVTSFIAQERPYALIRLIDQGRLHDAEREVDHSHRRYEAIFSNAALPIVVCNRQGVIVSANQLAEVVFGYSPGQLTTLLIEQLVPQGLSGHHELLRRQFNEAPQVRMMGQHLDLQACRRDGTTFPVEISLSYFRLEDELYAVAYIVDISLKKQAEQQLVTKRDQIVQLNAELEHKVADRTHALMNTLDQLRQSKDELARALVTEQKLGELKSRFVSMASHEFRTPLTVLKTSASILERQLIDVPQFDKRKKHFDRIRSSIKHLNDILEEFLLVGKLEEGKVELHVAGVNLDQLVQETVADMQELMKPEQTVTVQISCPEPVWLDPSLLHKVLVNLLTNAIKYSGPSSTVTVAGSCTASVLTLSVQDQGIGISSEDQQHLFERFYRANNVSNIAGTGLGLHIVGRYVAIMGGHVVLQSELNQGTRVTLHLPYEHHSVD